MQQSAHRVFIEKLPEGGPVKLEDGQRGTLVRRTWPAGSEPSTEDRVIVRFRGNVERPVEPQRIVRK